MKTNILTAFILAIFLFSSCTDKDDLTINLESNSVDLSAFLSEYEIVNIDVPELFNTLKSQHSQTKNFSILQGRYNFKVSNSGLTGDPAFYSYNESLEFDEVPTVEHNTLYLDNVSLQNENPVGLILRENDLYMEFTKSDETYVISPLRELVTTANSNEFVLYKTSAMLDSNESESECQTYHAPTDFNQDSTSEAETRAAQYNVRNTVVIDYSMYNRLGWNGSINYVNDAMFMTNYRYNAYSALPISIIKGNGYILNRSDQYGLAYTSSPTGYLNNYAAWLNQYGIADDASILFTSDHAHWGAAYPNQICSYYAVAVVEYHSWSTRRYNIVAHEIGHILGAGHTTSGVMTTVANGSSYFSQYSKNQILSYLSYSNWCLY